MGTNRIDLFAGLDLRHGAHAGVRALGRPSSSLSYGAELLGGNDGRNWYVSALGAVRYRF